MYRRILVVNDGSSDGFAALHDACDVAAQFRAELHVACVQKTTAFPATMVEVKVEEAEAELRSDLIVERSRQVAGLKGVMLWPHFVLGSPAAKILKLLEDDRFDLLILPCSRHSVLYRWFVATETERLIGRAPCAVLLVR